MYSKLKNTHALAAKVCFGCRCAGLFKLVRVFMLLAVTLLGFGLLTGIWMAVTAALSNTSPYAVTHTQIHKGVFNHTHPPRHTHTHSELKVLNSDAAIPELLLAHKNQT